MLNEDRMDQRDMAQEEQNGKRKGCVSLIFFLKMLFLCLDKIVIRNPKPCRANKALLLEVRDK
jgi:hypothetical protein